MRYMYAKKLYMIHMVYVVIPLADKPLAAFLECITSFRAI